MKSSTTIVTSIMKSSTTIVTFIMISSTTIVISIMETTLVLCLIRMQVDVMMDVFFIIIFWYDCRDAIVPWKVIIIQCRHRSIVYRRFAPSESISRSKLLIMAIYCVASISIFTFPLFLQLTSFYAVLASTCFPLISLSYSDERKQNNPQ